MIIDFHTHIFPENISAEREKYFFDPGFKLLYDSKKSLIAGPAQLLESMEAMKIDFSVAMCFPWEDEQACIEHNTFLAETASNSRGRILSFGMVPLKSRSVHEDVSEIFNAGLSGIGEIAFYNNMSEENWIFLEEVFENALCFGLPVCVHVNEPLGHDYCGKYSTSFPRLYEAIKKSPGLKIILSHWGGGILFYELMPEVKKVFENVYYDTAASPYLYKDEVYRIASEICGPDKIIFGTDFPLLSAEKYKKGIKDLVDGAAVKKIMGENAFKLLGLSTLPLSGPGK